MKRGHHTNISQLRFFRIRHDLEDPSGFHEFRVLLLVLAIEAEFETDSLKLGKAHLQKHQEMLAGASGAAGATKTTN